MFQNILLMLFLNFLLIYIFTNISSNNFFYMSKEKEFECGFNSIMVNRNSFSLQYYLITILFLIFDLEIILLMPFIVEENFFTKSFLMMMNLILILTVMLLIEWKYSMLEWAK